jgi:hypothetical protein
LIDDDASCISSNSSISSASSFITSRRSRRSATASALSRVDIDSAITTTQRHVNRYTSSTNKPSRVHDPRMTPDVLSTPLPHEFRFIGDGDVAHDEMLSHHANASTKGGRLVGTKKKEVDTQSHIPRVIIDCRTDTDSHRKKWHITLVGSA